MKITKSAIDPATDPRVNRQAMKTKTLSLAAGFAALLFASSSIASTNPVISSSSENSVRIGSARVVRALGGGSYVTGMIEPSFGYVAPRAEHVRVAAYDAKLQTSRRSKNLFKPNSNQIKIMNTAIVHTKGIMKTRTLGHMKTKQLGNSDLFITPVGYGSWAIGGSGWQFAWGKQNDNDSVAAIHRALELGVNWIDTAAVYGLGHSEEVVTQALASWPGPRPYVFTKCGLRWDAQGQTHRVLTAASIRRECEDSLRRLKVDTIDLYQIHWLP